MPFGTFSLAGLAARESFAAGADARPWASMTRFAFWDDSTPTVVGPSICLLRIPPYLIGTLSP